MTLLVSLQPLVDSSNPLHRPVIQAAQMTSVIKVGVTLKEHEDTVVLVPWQEGFSNIVESLLALIWRCLALCFRYQCWLVNKQRTLLSISISDSFHKKKKNKINLKCFYNRKYWLSCFWLKYDVFIPTRDLQTVQSTSSLFIACLHSDNFCKCSYFHCYFRHRQLI